MGPDGLLYLWGRESRESVGIETSNAPLSDPVKHLAHHSIWVLDSQPCLMEVSLNLFGISVLQQWRNFSCFISVPWEHAALQFNILNWQGTVEEGRGGIRSQNSLLMKDQKKKKNHNASSAHSKTHPRNLQRVKKSSTANCKRKSFPLTLRTVFSCQITTQENTIIRIKKGNKKARTTGTGKQELPAPFPEKTEQREPNPLPSPPPTLA